MSCKVVNLSYPFSNKRFYYGGSRLRIERHIKESDNRYNQETTFHISSHSSTHIDFPAHFYPTGKKGESYPLEFFLFHKVALVDCNLLKDNHNVDISIVHKSINRDMELILFKTHFCEIRDKERYWKDSPVVSSHLADDLRKLFPKLRMVGFDIISTTSQCNKSEGRKAHLRFLDESNEREILLIEDMDLKNVDGNTVFPEVIVSPIFFDNMDGSPCTVIAKVK